MYKLLLLSVVIATLVLPMRAARQDNPLRGLRRALWGIFALNALYIIAIASYVRLPI